MPVANAYRGFARYAGTQTDEDFAREMAQRALPWTRADLELVRQKAQAMMRTHIAVDLPGNRTVSAFDGHAVWELMGALDRAGRLAPEETD